MSTSSPSFVLGRASRGARVGTALSIASGFVLALPFMAVPAMAAPASATPFANPAHHHAAAAHALAASTRLSAAPALVSTPAHTFHPLASAPDAPQDPGHLNSGVCFSTAPGNPCTLRAAVMEADAEQKYIAIVLQSGTYHLTIGPTGTTDASTGNLDVTDAQTVTFTGAGLAHTTIDGSGMSTGPDTGDRIFQIEEHGVARMTGFTVQRGDAADNPDNTDPGNGGGIDISSTAASLVLQQVRIRSNTAASNGGGLYDAGALWATKSELSGNTAESDGGGLYAESNATLVDVAITGNNAVVAGGGAENHNGGVSFLRGTVSNNHLVFTDGGARGGGIFVDDATTIVGTSINNNTIEPASGATPEIFQGAQGGGLYVDYGLNQADHLTIHGNTVAGVNSQDAFGDGGGGIYDSGGFTLTNSVISGNKALDGVGGGLLNDGEVEHLSRVTVSGNRAVTGDGGGIYGYDVTYITQSSITGNLAGGNGGGFWSDDGQQIDQTLIANNTAVQGGGFWNEWKANLTNDTLTGNIAVGTGNAGGAFYNSTTNTSSETAQLTNVTIQGNRSDDGGGIAQFGGGFTVHNTIVAGNKANSGNTDTNCDITSSGASPLTDAGNNIDSGNTCDFDGPGSRFNTNPKLGALANNGGPTKTEALLAGSPAINHGSSPAPTVDQRGVARDSRPDIGAFEVHN